MRKKIYYAVNIAVAFVALLSFFRIIQVVQYQSKNRCIFQFPLFFIGALLCTGFVYLLKGFRLYLILMEKQIAFKRFLRIYVKTTLVTLVLPWKSGEFFRIFCYGEEMRDYRSSLLSVVVDRYFDSVPLLAVVSLYYLIRPIDDFLLIWILLLFVLTFTIIYLIFPSLYQYFNRFLIMKSPSKNDIAALEILEKIYKWYCYIEGLVKGRVPLLTILSAAAWLFEYFSLIFLSKILSAPCIIE